jgi:NADPH:quinone reductase-like Zn-dependent oxidoreductase
MMGEDVLRQAFEVVKRGGWVISLLRAHRELGEQLAAHACLRCEFILVHPSGEQLAEIARLCDADQLNVHLDAVFPLQDVAQAHKLSESRHVRGKLVPTVA